MEFQWHLYKSDFFSDLHQEKQEFMALATERNIKKGAFIFHEGDMGDAVFYLVAGAAKLFRTSLNGDEITSFIRRQGEIVGLAEYINRQERKCSAAALTPCRLFEVKTQDFELIISRHPTLARRVIEVLSARVRYLTELMTNLAVCDTRSRLLRFIVYLCYNQLMVQGASNKPVAIGFGLSQQEIAHAVGASRQTVNEVLRSLNEEGIISVSKNEIVLLRPLDLLKFAEV